MLAMLRRMVISFAHAFPPPPDTITILPPPPRPQDQLPHCRGLAPRRVPHCSAPRHTNGCAAQARQRRLAPGPAARRGGGRPAAGGVLRSALGQLDLGARGRRRSRWWSPQGRRPPHGQVSQTRGLEGSGRDVVSFGSFLDQIFYGLKDRKFCLLKIFWARFQSSAGPSWTTLWVRHWK